MSVIHQFSNTKSIIGYKAFWRHSLTAANLSLIIADSIKHDTLEQYRQELFLAGLLHDIGILIYDQFFHEEFTKIIDCALGQDKTYLSSEGIISPKETHAFIGGALLEIWKLALPVVSAVRNHHSPEKASEKLKELVAVMALVEYVLCNSHVGSFEGTIESIDDSVWDITGISPEKIDMLHRKAEAEAGKTDVVLSLGTVYKRPVRRKRGKQSPLRKI
jgi:HD-like signal output (HDOD) protein